jgi:hypothetical protein
MTSTEITAAEPDHGSGEAITVWVGVPAITRGLPNSGSLLVVEAEPQRARELRQALRDRPEALVCEEVLAAVNEATVRWHRFNDTRLNGPSDLTIWQQRFPNVRQIDVEQRCGRRLGDLLDNWVPHGGDQALASLHLVLRQGDPLAALAGLGPWISHLQTVQMMLPWPEETIQLAEAWLAEQNFDKDPQASSLWNRDPVATRDCLLQEKEKEKLELLAANQQLNSDCEAPREEKDILAAKLELLSTQWQELRQIQAHTLSKIQQSQTEAESLKSLQEALQQECQQLTYEKSELQRKLQTEEATNLNNIEAVKNLFPLQHYKEISSDLGDLDEDQMVLHYLQHGRHEIRLKTYLELDNELKSCFKQREEAEAKVKLLETQFDLVKQHLENMKDLFARLADRPQSLQQITEE